MLLTPKAAAKALKLREKQLAVAKKFDLKTILFPEQLKLVEDPASFKMAVCSRRAGKTVACAAHLIDTAVKNPEVVCVYITLSRNNAKKIVWRELKKINKENSLGGVPNSSELSMSFPNGSIIYLSGAKDSNEIEKFRGLAIKLCYIDEAQSFRSYIQELIDDVIAPALMDYAGTLVLIGTPGPILAGYFYECWSNDQAWSKHHWTFWDNPFISQKSTLSHKEVFQRELKRRGALVSDPSIQREWFGKWINDSDSLLIKYNKEKNDYATVPDIKPRNYNYVMGIDLGFNDADALAVLAWDDASPTTYLVEESIVPKQDLTELVNEINKLRKKYDISKMVIDEGGLGKKLAEEMRRRHKLPVEAAEKTRKMENVAFLNDALRTGMFKAKEKSRFAQDTYLVEIDRDKSKPDKIVVSDRYHSDIIDAVLYAFKLSPAYSFEPPKPKPKYGTPEWAEQETDNMFEAELNAQLLEQEIAQADKEFWGDDF